jgi:hypothetical protein
MRCPRCSTVARGHQRDQCGEGVAGGVKCAFLASAREETLPRKGLKCAPGQLSRDPMASGDVAPRNRHGHGK